MNVKKPACVANPVLKFYLIAFLYLTKSVNSGIMHQVGISPNTI